LPKFDENEAFAILLTNLGKKKRTENLLKIAEYCVRLKERYGSWTELSKRIKISDERAHISPEMLREFGAILDLSEEVKMMIQKDMITSVDTAYRISRLKSKKDQIELANAVIKRKMSASDVRAVVEYKTKSRNIPVNEVVQRILESKTKVVTHHLIIMELQMNTYETLKREAQKRGQTAESLAFRILGEKWNKNEILSFGMRGSDIILKLAEDKFKALQQEARALHIELKDLAENLIRKAL